MRKAKTIRDALPRTRHYLLMSFFICLIGVLAVRAATLQVYKSDEHRAHVDGRNVDVANLLAARGPITDRNGEPLAIDVAMAEVIADPTLFKAKQDQLGKLAKLLRMKQSEVRGVISKPPSPRYAPLHNKVLAEVADAVDELNIPGVDVRRKYLRFYPAGEVASHIVGFTGHDGVGQEGLEKSFEQHLAGKHGRQQRVLDGRGNSVAGDLLDAPYDGKELRLTLDLRLQSLLHNELSRAVQKHRAKTAAAVLLDAKTGEILALVNQPAFNPNSPKKGKAKARRNRAMLDRIEPGSTLKPFAVASALQSGLVEVDSVIKTNGGKYRVGPDTVRDFKDYGDLDIAGILRKSSNVGASKLALMQTPNDYEHMLRQLGFGQSTNSGYPYEVSGTLTPAKQWSRFRLATLGYGYGLSVTALQLAQSYTALSNDGVWQPASLIYGDKAKGHRVFDAGIARAVRQMMISVVDEGTGTRAALDRFTAAGKTGTVRLVKNGKYIDDAHRALFAGIAPAGDPRLVLTVIINEPRSKEYYGGQVAAPVFRQVMTEALRILNVAPDSSHQPKVRMANMEALQ